MSKNYAEMNKEELVNIAKENGITGISGASKAVLIAKLNNANLETGAEMEKTEEVKAPTYAVNAMRKAIIAAHKTNNKKAITVEMALAGDATEERFNQWVQWVQDLRDVTVDYIVLKHKKSATDKELEVARGRIFPAWRTILKVGEEDIFHKNMFIRKEDIDSIVGYAETFMATSKGTAMAVTGKLVFRKQIEALLGCRMAGNSVLKDADRDCLQNYYSAQRTLQNVAKRLNGSNDKDGKHEPGILDNIKATEQRIKDGETMLKVLGVADAEIENHPLLTGMRNALKDLQNQKKQCEDAQKNAEKTTKELVDRVEQIEDLLNEIEA